MVALGIVPVTVEFAVSTDAGTLHSPETMLRKSNICGGWDSRHQCRQMVLLLDILQGEEESVGVRGERITLIKHLCAGHKNLMLVMHLNLIINCQKLQFLILQKRKLGP